MEALFNRHGFEGEGLKFAAPVELDGDVDFLFFDSQAGELDVLAEDRLIGLRDRTDEAKHPVGESFLYALANPAGGMFRLLLFHSPNQDGRPHYHRLVR